ncbi:Efflux pump membrane transporter BepE [Planctomycetes bacterium Poly30]|uniref:Efflux pump membrane transporter BepE n=1 Tax=Saltatorellus ferox TaxID=2528018 RepID=A0A518ERK1_9BACT|nr:Efflux pump membrane transporter BepE [Planctomycetes bacterium Poly30]
MISRFFIDRPVFSIVLSLLISIVGAVSIFVLPVAQFPEIVPPTIEITAAYPGADAETVAEAVAAPIEQELSGAQDLIYYQSQSSNNGQCKITVSFEIGADQDFAAVEVQNRLSIAEAKLPAEVTRQGITVRKVSSSILGVVALQSPEGTYDDLYLSNFATINLLDRLRRVEGVGDATSFGNKDYSMRIWIDPDRLALKGMTIADVTAKLRDQNAVFPAGTVGQRPTDGEVLLTLPMLTRGRLQDVSEYEKIILRAEPDGQMVRLADVARIELGPQGYNLTGRLDGQPTATMLISQKPGANALQTMSALRAELALAAEKFPEDITWSIPYDTTKFVGASINEVVRTLIEAVLLVLAIVFVFLQSWRATLIPLLAVPVAIIGAFAGMLALGFSINTLTLFGLVLAIGIVVDDAIIVVENVERIMEEEGLAVREATIKAMDQVTGPVITIVLVLSAVFVPVAFLGGFTGQMYQQFAVTIAISVAISGLVALTLSPALCRLLLRPAHGKKNVLARGFDRAFGGLTDAFGKGARLVIRGALFSLLVFGGLLYATVRMNDTVPGGFLPQEDQGYVMAIAMLPDGSSLDQTQKVVEQAEAFYLDHPAVDHVVALVGFDILNGRTTATNMGIMFVPLKSFEERAELGVTADDMVALSQQLTMQVEEGLIITINPPAIRGLGTRSGFTAELQQLSGGTIAKLSEVGQKFMDAAQAHPMIETPNSTLRVSLPQVFVDLDREKAQMMGIDLASVFEPMQAFFGSLYVNDFNQYGRVWRVQVQAEPSARTTPQDIEDIYVRNRDGEMVPLAALVDTRFQVGPNIVTRYNGYSAIEITGAPPVGISSSEAMDAVREIAAETLPPGYGIDWSGASYQEIRAGNQAPLVLMFGLLIVFLVLAAQYESWSLPVAVLLSVPLAVLGALLAAWMRGYSQDIYFQIGLLTLVGLSAKNAILIVEFCVELRSQGKGIVESAVEATILRFRPIVMTSLAFILGVLPLAIATGAGAAGRRSIGTGVIGGMLMATFVSILFVPLFYTLIQRAVEFLARGKARAGEGGEGAFAPEPAG